MATANAFFATCIVLFFLRILEVCLVVQQLGTLQLMVQRVLTQDLVRYLIYQAMFVVAFGTGIAFLLAQSSEDPLSWPAVCQALFFALFNLTDLEPFEDTAWTLALFALYNVASVILLLNLLIAMLNKSYMDIETGSDHEWKTRFSALVIEYSAYGTRRNLLPAPFSALQLAVGVCFPEVCGLNDCALPSDGEHDVHQEEQSILQQADSTGYNPDFSIKYLNEARKKYGDSTGEKWERLTRFTSLESGRTFSANDMCKSKVL